MKAVVVAVVGRCERLVNATFRRDRTGRRASGPFARFVGAVAPVGILVAGLLVWLDQPLSPLPRLASSASAVP